MNSNSLSHFAFRPTIDGHQSIEKLSESNEWWVSFLYPPDVGYRT